MKIAVRHAARFEVSSRAECVFDLLAHVPRSARHFPGLHELIPLGDNGFRWEMTPITLLGFSHQVIYACRYVNDADGLGLSWEPVPGIGNSTIRGRWRLEPGTGGNRAAVRTTVNFETSGQLDVPVPNLLRTPARPAVDRRFRSMIDDYHTNLRVTLER